jgi:hypothetical protein
VEATELIALGAAELIAVEAAELIAAVDVKEAAAVIATGALSPSQNDTEVSTSAAASRGLGSQEAAKLIAPGAAELIGDNDAMGP